LGEKREEEGEELVGKEEAREEEGAELVGKEEAREEDGAELVGKEENCCGLGRLAGAGAAGLGL